MPNPHPLMPPEPEKRAKLARGWQWGPGHLGIGTGFPVLPLDTGTEAGVVFVPTKGDVVPGYHYIRRVVGGIPFCERDGRWYRFEGDPHLKNSQTRKGIKPTAKAMWGDDSLYCVQREQWGKFLILRLVRGEDGTRSSELVASGPSADKAWMAACMAAPNSLPSLNQKEFPHV